MAIIIVDDGAYRWGAKSSELLGYLRLNGWKIDGQYVTEPEGPGFNEWGDAEGEQPYEALCQAVLPVAGYEPEKACKRWDKMRSLRADPQSGPRAWVLA
jgi:hypothetical protein